ncbi:tetratricopeptide repeat protein [Pararhodonellum marinum]|uniref:tetratricopeptide repeat protein n=1 Tax=Pararhodonellum marinum TaxID=2755358 RepID=UPI001E5CA85B|nr:tetratricopeptide repeat protein [Pararhodonellum marinum]
MKIPEALMHRLTLEQTHGLTVPSPPMTIKFVKIFSILFLTVGFMAGMHPMALAQNKPKRKELKAQHTQAQTSRLFVEGQKYLMLEEFEKAYFYFQKARELSPEEGAINFKIAEILVRANKNQEALDYGQRALEADPENKYYHLLMAEVYSNQNQPAKSAEILRSLMDNSEDNQQYILDLASLYLTAQDFDNALIALNEAEDFFGVAEQLTFQKQRIHLRNNDLESAIKEGETLIESNPGNSRYLLALVEILFNNNRIDEAIGLVKKNLETYPNQPDVKLAAYTLLKQKDQMEEANVYLLEAFAHPDLEGEVKAKVFEEIMAEFKSSAREEMLDELTKLMLLHNPNDPDVTGILGNRAFQNGKIEEGLTYYKESLSLNPANENILQNVITVMFERGEDFGEIEKYTVMAVEEFPEKPEFWFFDGTAKLAQKNHQEAAVSLEKSEEINAGKNQQLDLLVWGQLGDTYHQLDKKDKAFDYYEKVLAKNPNQEHVLNNYAYFLSLEKKDLDKAKSMSEKLVKRFPTNATYLDTHAWVLFQLEEYQEAEKYMKLALENEAEPSGVMLEHYGDILYRLGDPKGALSYWQKAKGGDDTTEFLDQKIKDKRYYE